METSIIEAKQVKEADIDNHETKINSARKPPEIADHIKSEQIIGTRLVHNILNTDIQNKEKSIQIHESVDFKMSGLATTDNVDVTKIDDSIASPFIGSPAMSNDVKEKGINIDNTVIGTKLIHDQIEAENEDNFEGPPVLKKRKLAVLKEDIQLASPSSSESKQIDNTGIQTDPNKNAKKIETAETSVKENKDLTSTYKVATQTDENSYECQICKKCYTQRRRFHKHVRAHIERKPISVIFVRNVLN